VTVVLDTELIFSLSFSSQPMFGWVQNLLEKYRDAVDRNIRDSSLPLPFVLFCSLIRAQLPSNVKSIEHMICTLPVNTLNTMATLTLPPSEGA